MTESTGTARVVRPQDGDRARFRGMQDRFLIDGADTEARFALVGRRFDPQALAAPIHLHRDEDEFSYILEGRMGAVIDGEEPLVVLELISPARLEQFFRASSSPDRPPDPDDLAERAAAYGCVLDFDATLPLVARHGLVL